MDRAHTRKKKSWVYSWKSVPILDPNWVPTTKYSMKSVQFWCPRCRTSTLLRARHRRAALPPHPTLRALTTRGAAAAVAAPPPCGSTRRRWQEQ